MFELVDELGQLNVARLAPIVVHVVKIVHLVQVHLDKPHAENGLLCLVILWQVFELLKQICFQRLLKLELNFRWTLRIGRYELEGNLLKTSFCFRVVACSNNVV